MGRGQPQEEGSRFSGWRKLAVFNIIGILILALSLSGLLAFSSIRAGGLTKVLVLLERTCHETQKINLGLHLATNAVSTCILASANFFMQILTAPSRQDIDLAHSERSYVEIGVQSLLNFPSLKRTNLLAWIALLLTSLPLHLFFNSVVFSTDAGVSKHLTVLAAEPWTQGASFSTMGASLTPLEYTTINEYNEGSTSFISKKLPELIKVVSTWEYLEPLDCHAIYFSDKPLVNRRDLVVIIDNEDDEDTIGWMQDELWSNLTTEQEYWVEKYFPNGTINSLWATEWWYTDKGDDLWPAGTHSIPKPNGWYISYASEPFGEHGNLYGFPGNDDIVYRQFSVRYCLSEPVTTMCKVAISNSMLLAVVICTIAKAITCTVVFKQLWHENPLATLGDAIDSFLTNSDAVTAGMCTYGWREMEKLRNSGSYGGGNSETVPRQWVRKKARYWTSIPLWIQISYYTFIIAVISATGYLLHMAKKSKPQDEKVLTSFGPGSINDYIGMNWLPHGSIALCALIANLPQVALSICYFLYNALFTRLLVAKEWARFSVVAQPLRVTAPKGSQVSTYWLQLPYRFSLPLLAISVVMHWLVSNCIFVFVGEGEFYTKGKTLESDLPDAFIAVGYSRKAMIIVLIVSPCLLLVPILFGLWRIPGHMTIAGSNSLAISAACHAQADFASVQEDKGIRAEIYVRQRLITSMSCHALSWGEIHQSNASNRASRLGRQSVGHLGFGLASEVTPPVDGKLYA